MADLGDVSVARAGHQSAALTLSSPAVPDICAALPTGGAWGACSPWTDTKRPVGVTVAIPTALRVALLHAGIVVDRADSDGTHARFYDYNDGTYTAVTNDGTAAWSVVISGSAATVTPTFEAYPTILAGDRLVVIAGDGKLKTRPPA